MGKELKLTYNSLEIIPLSTIQEKINITAISFPYNQIKEIPREIK